VIPLPHKLLICNNSTNRIAGKTILIKHGVNAGAMKINDLMTSDSRIISYSCFKDKFCFPVSFLEFCGVTSAIRSAKRYLKLTLPGEKIQENVVQQTKSGSLQNPHHQKMYSPRKKPKELD